MDKYKIEIFNSGSNSTLSFDSRELLNKVVESIFNCLKQDMCKEVNIHYSNHFRTVILPKQYLQNSIITVHHGEE